MIDKQICRSKNPENDPQKKMHFMFFFACAILNHPYNGLIVKQH